MSARPAGTSVWVSRRGSKKRARAPSATTIRVRLWRGSRRGAFDWDRQIDALMLKSAATFDRAGRLQAFVDAQKLYLQHLPAIFFGAPHVRVATSMRTLNATPSPLRPHLLWNAENLAALK